MKEYGLSSSLLTFTVTNEKLVAMSSQKLKSKSYSTTSILLNKPQSKINRN